MYINEMLEKYKDWKLLFIFLKNPDYSFYTKEISRKTGIGSGTVNNFLRNIHKDEILTKEIVGNVHLYRLNNELEIVKHLKIFNHLLELKNHKFVEKFLKLDNKIISIVLYGSYANGENDSKSDIDILLIVNSKTNFINTIQQLEEKMKKTISIQIMKISDWQTLKEKDKIFYESIIENHIILYGSGLP
jgi:predicted nucleotidyltransferase